MFGIDVSEHNGTINWDKVKSQVEFAILRLGWIGNKDNHTMDKQFERNYNECKRLGIPIGIYVFNYCESEASATSGASWTISKLNGKKIELPVYIDMEDDDKQPQKLSRLGKDKLSNIVHAFNKHIESIGLWAGVYANRDWFDNYLNKEIRSRYTTWIAHYTSGTDKYKWEYDIWQNSPNGKIEGISGNVDTNYMYRDLIAEIGNKKQSVPTQKTMSIVDLAYEVINGKYGNGEERKKALGYLYNDVQAKVNEILDDKKQIIYAVKKGDTLSSIAQKYNTTYQEIAKKNNISDPNKINVGQKLKI